MATKYTNHFNTKNTPQTQPIPGTNQVANSAGGFSFQLDDFKRVERFLVLGSDGGSYYASEQTLTQENAKCVIDALKKDGPRVVKLIVDISTNGRAYRNDPAIFALALATAFGDAATKKLAYDAIVQVCRTGTHLFTFCENVQALRGWSAGLRRGVSNYYTNKSENALANQLIKYRQRNGWTHRDVLRLSHPSVAGMRHEMLKWAVNNPKKQPTEFHPTIEAFIKVQDPNTTLKQKVKLITDHKLPWEALPTEVLKEVAIWEALLPDMGLTAAVRNMGKMTSIGMFKSALSDDTKAMVAKFTKDQVLQSKVHPLQVLLGLHTYQQGHGQKGSLTWTPNKKLITTLDDAFYMAFKNVVPTNKNTMLALDISGSMSGAMTGTGISCAMGSTAMALVTANVEPNYEIVGFSNVVKDLGITHKDTLSTAMTKTSKWNFGSTDCAAAMQYAMTNKIPVETFVVYTDSETYAGHPHPSQALQQYRQKMGIPAKLAVVGMVSNPFTIADPNDAGMLDVVGFDTNTPAVIADFSR